MSFFSSESFPESSFSHQGLNYEQSCKLVAIQRALMENALDYAESFASEFLKTETSSSRYKYILLYLWSTIELMMKSRLILDDWKEIIIPPKNRVDPPSFEKFAEGEYKTKYFGELFESLCTVLSQKENRDLIDLLTRNRNVLRNFGNLRNKFEHFTDSSSIVAHYKTSFYSHANDVSKLRHDIYEPIVFSVWSFVMEFFTILIDQVDGEIPGGADFGWRWTQIKKDSIIQPRFVKYRHKQIGPKLDELRINKVPIFKCFQCEQTALPFEEGIMYCCFCCSEHHDFFQDWFERRTGDLLDRSGVVPVSHPLNAGICPQCEEQGYFLMVDEILLEAPEIATICFCCHYVGFKLKDV